MVITGGCMRQGSVPHRSGTDYDMGMLVPRLPLYRAGSRTVNVTFLSEKLHIEESLGDYATTAASGNVYSRGFCPTCGTPVTTQSEARQQFLAVRAGTLDDPEIGKPDLTIWTSSAPSWACFAEDLPQEAKQPPPPQ
jgi:hypothetical protein